MLNKGNRDLQTQLCLVPSSGEGHTQGLLCNSLHLLFSLLGVCQNLIGSAELLELLLSCSVSWIFIWMNLDASNPSAISAPPPPPRSRVQVNQTKDVETLQAHSPSLLEVRLRLH